MAPTLFVQPTRVATDSADEEGRLVLADGQLVAVLVRLADASHTGLVGSWFLEVGFGPCAVVTQPTFANLDAALAWVQHRLAAVRTPVGARRPPLSVIKGESDA